MRKVRVNYDQILEVISMHLESLGVINHTEHIELTPLVLDKMGLITIYIYPNKGSMS